MLCIAWTMTLGNPEGHFSIFWADILENTLSIRLGEIIDEYEIRSPIYSIIYGNGIGGLSKVACVLKKC